MLDDAPFSTATETELSLIKNALRSLGKCIKAFTTYPPNHPIYQKFSTEVLAKFDLFFKVQDTLPLKITKNAMLYKDQEVYTSQDRNDNAALMLYIDGVREICFYIGLTLEEIADFINILRRSTQKGNIDDDIVTLLWEKDLEHFTYFVPETIGFEEFDSADEKFLADRMEGTEKSRNLSGTTLQLPTDEELQKLRESLTGLSGDKLLIAAIDLLFDMLLSERDPAGFEQIMKHIGAGLTMLLERNMLKKAIKVLSTLRGYAESDSLGEYRQTINSLINKAGTDQAVHDILNSEQDPEDIEKYLLLLNTNAITPLLEALGYIEDRKMRRLTCNVLTVLGKGNVKTVAGGLKNKQWFLVRNAAMIIGTIKDPAGIPFLSEVIKHPEAKVRREVIKSLELIGSKEAKTPLVASLRDADSSIRIAALKALRRVAEFDIFEDLKSIVLREEFRERPFDEKRAFFEALAEANKKKAFPILAEFFQKKRFFMKADAKELRVCAAYGLGIIGTPEASDLLKQESDAGDPLLKEASRKALRAAGKR